MGRRAKQVASHLVLWLAVGAAVNVGITWLTVQLGHRGVLDYLGIQRSYQMDGRWPFPLPDDWRRESVGCYREGRGWSDALIVLGYRRAPPGAPPSRYTGAVGTVYGLPCRCLGEYVLEAGFERESHNLITFKVPGVGGILLPTCPLWPGFAINAAVFALAGWSVIRGPGTLRRWRRRRAGRCAECGYDLQGLVPGAPCPECGAAGAGARTAALAAVTAR